jgi:hypothetical protein
MTATATAPRTEAEVEQLEGEWSDLLSQLADDLERMKSDNTPGPVVIRHEQAYGNLHRAMLGLRSPEAVSALEARDRARDESTTDGERALFSKCEALAKSDPTLSPAEQMRRAMADPEILARYHSETGKRPVVSAAPRQALAKAADDGYDEHGADVDARCDALVKSGMRPSLAYATAMRESGAYVGAGAAA